MVCGEKGWRFSVVPKIWSIYNRDGMVKKGKDSGRLRNS